MNPEAPHTGLQFHSGIKGPGFAPSDEMTHLEKCVVWAAIGSHILAVSGSQAMMLLPVHTVQPIRHHPWGSPDRSHLKPITPPGPIPKPLAPFLQSPSSLSFPSNCLRSTPSPRPLATPRWKPSGCFLPSFTPEGAQAKAECLLLALGALESKGLSALHASLPPPPSASAPSFHSSNGRSSPTQDLYTLAPLPGMPSSMLSLSPRGSAETRSFQRVFEDHLRASSIFFIPQHCLMPRCAYHLLT